MGELKALHIATEIMRRLLVSDCEADNFYQDVLSILGPDIKINEHTFKFWKEA